MNNFNLFYCCFLECNLFYILVTNNWFLNRLMYFCTLRISAKPNTKCNFLNAVESPLLIPFKMLNNVFILFFLLVFKIYVSIYFLLLDIFKHLYHNLQQALPTDKRVHKIEYYFAVFCGIKNTIYNCNNWWFWISFSQATAYKNKWFWDNSIWVKKL